MWIDLLPTLLLLQNIAVQAQLPPMPKSAHFTQIRCDGITQSRNNQIALFDGDGKSLGSAAEGCSLINPFPCKLEGLGNITVGPYIVSHPGAFFGACFYKDVKMEIIATDGINTVKQQLFATCGIENLLCGDPTTPAFGVVNQVDMHEFPSVNDTSIVLREYNKDGCPADQNFADQISNHVGCNLITNTGITNVVVVPKPDMPSTCVLTLFADTNCESPSNADIGPIAPASHPSACIGPIRNPKGDVFEAKSAYLEC